MSRNVPVIQVLRQVCLYSISHNGIKQKKYDTFRKDFIQVYGYNHILTLQNLERIRLIYKHDGTKSTYPSLIKNLQLIGDYESSVKHRDVSSVYAGYAPISVRLIQAACQLLDPSKEPTTPTWANHLETLKLLPGAFVEQNLPSPTGFKKAIANPSTLVVFIGGVTLAEISAIRVLSETSGIFVLIQGESLLF